MKRFFSIIFSILMVVSICAFCFAGCGNDNSDKCTITFETFGGTQLEEIIVNKGEKANEPKRPKKEGMYFRGWFLDNNFNEEWKFRIDKVDSDIKLYAKFSRQYKVEFYVDNEKRTSNNVWENELVKKPGKSIMPGYRVEEWFSDVEMTKVYDFNLPVNSNLNIYAKSSEINEWVFNNTTDGFYMENDSSGGMGHIEFEEDYAIFYFDTNKTADSHIRVDDILINIDDPDKKQINIEYQNLGSCRDIRVYYISDDMIDYDADDYIQIFDEIMPPLFEGWHTARVVMKDVTKWKGTLKSLRFDFPTELENTIKIKRIWFSAVDEIYE